MVSEDVRPAALGCVTSMCVCVCGSVWRQRDVCVLQRVEAALASAWGGSGPAPLRPPPPSLFVASGSTATAGASPTKSEREPPFGFVREELARFSLESRGRSGGGSSSKGSGVRSSRDAADGRRLQSHLQLRSSSSSSSSSSSNSSDHSGDSEDSLQADSSTTAFAPGHAPRSTADAIMAQGSDSEVTPHPPCTTAHRFKPEIRSFFHAARFPPPARNLTASQVDRIDSALQQYQQRYH